MLLSYWRIIITGLGKKKIIKTACGTGNAEYNEKPIDGGAGTAAAR